MLHRRASSQTSPRCRRRRATLDALAHLVDLGGGDAVGLDAVLLDVLSYDRLSTIRPNAAAYWPLFVSGVSARHNEN
jgi:hypothetical protein